MTIVMLILKLIGIVLLSILGLLLFLILIMLFSPIYYCGWASYPDDSWEGGFKVHWLLHMIRINIRYPDDGSSKISILWKHINWTSSEPQDENGAAESLSDVQDTMEVQNTTEDQSSTEGQSSAEGQSSTEDQRSAEGHDNGNVNSDSDVTSEKKNIQYTIRRIYDKIKTGLSEMEFYLDLLNEPDTIMLIEVILKRMRKLVRALAPRRLDGRIEYCTGSPDTTAYVFGIYALLLTPHKGNLVLVPDMSGELKELKGNVELKGHIIPASVLLNGIFVAFDRRLWRTWNRLKEHRKRTNG